MRWKKHTSLQRKCKRVLTKESQLIITKKKCEKNKEKLLLEHYSSDCCRQDSSVHVKVIGQ